MSAFVNTLKAIGIVVFIIAAFYAMWIIAIVLAIWGLYTLISIYHEEQDKPTPDLF